MPASKNDKNIARKLYQQGQDSAVIAEECSVSIRTAQRWIKSFEKEKVIVIGQENKVEPEAQTVEVLPALEATSTTSNGQSVELILTARTATRLLNLSELAISAVEDVLSAADSSPMSKLRAAQIVGKWVGFERDKASVVGTISLKAGVSASLDHSDSDEIRFTPHMAINKRQSEQMEAEEAQRKIEREMQLEKELQDKLELERQKRIDENIYKLACNFKRSEDFDELVQCEEFDGYTFLEYFMGETNDATAKDIGVQMFRKGLITQEKLEEFLEDYIL
jgi:hypothetical protein